MLLTCHTIFGVQRGDELLELIEETTGQPCPCRRGQPCPLMPNTAVVEPPAPRRSEAGSLRAIVALALAGCGLAATKAAALLL